MAEKARGFFLFILFFSIPVSIAGGDFAIIGLYLSSVYIFLRKREKWEGSAVAWGMAIFLLGAVLSSVFSSDPWASFTYFRRFWRLGLVFLVFFALRERDYSPLLRWTLIVSGIAAAYGLIQYSFGFDFLRATDFDYRKEYAGSSWHAIGLFSHHLTYGAVCLLLFSLFLPPVFNSGFSLKERAFWGTGAALNLLGIILCMGRSVWLATAGAILIIIFFQFNKKLFVTLSLLFFLILSAAVFALYQNGRECDDKLPRTVSQRVLCMSPGHNFDRVAMWKAAVNIVKDHPFLGLGPDRGEDMAPYYLEIAEKYNHEFDHGPEVGVHNIYLQNWIDFGLIGLAGYLIWWLALIIEIISAIAREPIRAARENSALLGCLAGLLGVMAAGFFENNFRDGEVQTAILTVMGIALSILRRKKLERKELNT